MGMTAQRRWRQRAAAEAQSPAAKPLPAFLPQAEHQLALQELTKSYELRLGQLQAEIEARGLTIDVDFDSEEFQAKLKPMVEEFEARMTEVAGRAEKAEAAQADLQKLLDEALAKVALLEEQNQSLSKELDALDEALLAPRASDEAALTGEASATTDTAQPAEAAPVDSGKPAEEPAPAPEQDAAKATGKGGKPKPR